MDSRGSRIIVYTRVWNDTKKRYDFYAIDSDGKLVPCYESGDTIQWVGPHLNTLLWNFVEYYWEGTDDPNYYYELYSQFSENYIAPQVSDGQIMQDSPIGINMDGRRKGQYYSEIVAWDDHYYSYAGLKADVDSGRVVSCPKSEADDFFFAIMEDLPVDDELKTVETVDSAQYGITMKIMNFPKREDMSNFLGSSNQYLNGNTEPGLLATNLEEDGYPISKGGNSLAEWFADAQEVNHLFPASTFAATGYYSYDSTENFATLKGDEFVLYEELGAMDNNGTGKFHTHGQFMPFNDLKSGLFTSVNTRNITSATGGNLPETDPRKYERLYLVQSPDYYFGMELEASFTQTPSGLDEWGHDIIYEFTGDDDFWLYVDGELVIDLGGIHDALPGSVNFRTGEVNVNGKQTTLRELFESNFKTRNPSATDEEVAEHLAKYFDEGSTIFRDYTTHTMRIFYFERGAGASNLHMRFNLASVKPGTAQLTKELPNVDTAEMVLAEFPYQIFYKDANGDEHQLSNAVDADPTRMDDYVFYSGTDMPVTYRQSVNIQGATYEDVFFLKPDEIAEISFPEGMMEYRVVECGVDTTVYDQVEANGTEIEGEQVIADDQSVVEGRKDYGIGYAKTDDRARVVYDNYVNPEAMRTLSFTKHLFREDGINEIFYPEDTSEFSFRLYLATEFDGAIDDSPAVMHTYHVRDLDGNYCMWDVDSQKFVTIGEGISNYDDLSNEQKESANFHTSTNGQISKIPAGRAASLSARTSRTPCCTTKAWWRRAPTSAKTP